MDTSKSFVFTLHLRERDEIDRLKWLESEKVGRDIGKNKALMDWITHHRRDWISGQMSEIHQSKLRDL